MDHHPRGQTDDSRRRGPDERAEICEAIYATMHPVTHVVCRGDMLGVPGRLEATVAAMAMTARSAADALLTTLPPLPLPDLCWTPPTIAVYGHLTAGNFTKVCIAPWMECPAEGPPSVGPLSIKNATRRG